MEDASTNTKRDRHAEINITHTTTHTHTRKGKYETVNENMIFDCPTFISLELVRKLLKERAEA